MATKDEELYLNDIDFLIVQYRAVFEDVTRLLTLLWLHSNTDTDVELLKKLRELVRYRIAQRLANYQNTVDVSEYTETVTVDFVFEVARSIVNEPTTIHRFFEEVTVGLVGQEIGYLFYNSLDTERQCCIQDFVSALDEFYNIAHMTARDNDGILTEIDVYKIMDTVGCFSVDPSIDLDVKEYMCSQGTLRYIGDSSCQVFLSGLTDYIHTSMYYLACLWAFDMGDELARAKLSYLAWCGLADQHLPDIIHLPSKQDVRAAIYNTVTVKSARDFLNLATLNKAPFGLSNPSEKKIADVETFVRAARVYFEKIVGSLVKSYEGLSFTDALDLMNNLGFSINPAMASEIQLPENDELEENNQVKYKIAKSTWFVMQSLAMLWVFGSDCGNTITYFRNCLVDDVWYSFHELEPSKLTREDIDKVIEQCIDYHSTRLALAVIKPDELMKEYKLKLVVNEKRFDDVEGFKKALESYMAKLLDLLSGVQYVTAGQVMRLADECGFPIHPDF